MSELLEILEKVGEHVAEHALSKGVDLFVDWLVPVMSKQVGLGLRGYDLALIVLAAILAGTLVLVIESCTKP